MALEIVVAEAGALVATVPDPLEARRRREVDALHSELMRAEARLDRALRARHEPAPPADAARAEVVAALLPTLDNLELALQRAQPPALHEGLRMTLRELARTLAEFGLGEHRPEPGARFDPKVHEALARRDGDGREECVVVELLRTGYSLDGRLLRPALVNVAGTL
jgi:molecular chaperone GrpE